MYDVVQITQYFVQSIIYILSSVFANFLKFFCFRRKSADTQRKQSRAGWKRLKFAWFHRVSARFCRISARNAKISIDFKWNSLDFASTPPFSGGFLPFPPWTSAFPVIYQRSGKSPEKASMETQNWKIPKPSPRWPCGCRGLAAFLYSRSTQKIMSVQFFLNVYFQSLVSATKLARIVQIINEFSRYCVPLRVKNFWCIIYLESEGGNKTSQAAFNKI